jgi:hypothetical protein
MEQLMGSGRKFLIGYAGRKVRWGFFATWGDEQRARPALTAPVPVEQPRALLEAA